MSRTSQLESNRYYRAVARAPRHHRFEQRGKGTVWVVADLVGDDRLCFWYAGRNNEELIEFERISDEADAVAWGQARSPSVRIRLRSTETLWAGAAARPKSLWKTWVRGAPHAAPDVTPLQLVRHRLDGLVSAREHGPWTGEQAEQYEQLCADERKLLATSPFCVTP